MSSCSSLSVQISQIVQSLACVPGGHSIKLVTRNYPRQNAQDVGHYEQLEQLFSPGDVPRELAVESRPEEVIITLEGELPGEPDKSQLLLPVVQILQEPTLDSAWDVRARFIGQTPRQGRYELTVFSTMPA